MNGGLADTFARLRTLLAEGGVRHAFIGALPVLAFGRVRATTDLDLVVACSAPELRELRARLAAAGFTEGGRIAPAASDDELPDLLAFFSGGSPSIRLDLFLAKTRFEEAVLSGARTATVFGAPVRLAAPEASIVYKLLASRGKDLDDVESIFVARAAAGDALDWAFLERWCVDWEIADRLQPFRARFGP